MHNQEYKNLEKPLKLMELFVPQLPNKCQEKKEYNYLKKVQMALLQQLYWKKEKSLLEKWYRCQHHQQKIKNKDFLLKIIKSEIKWSKEWKKNKHVQKRKNEK
jgi:hypothetical protein